jgi:hypothetical protein
MLASFGFKTFERSNLLCIDGRVAERSSRASIIASLADLLIALIALFIIRRCRRRQHATGRSRASASHRARHSSQAKRWTSPFRARPSQRQPLRRRYGPGAIRPIYLHALAVVPRARTTTEAFVDVIAPTLAARARPSRGSIFQECVWPPPSAASQLIDLLTSPSQNIYLGRIVTNIMGPQGTASEMGHYFSLSPPQPARTSRCKGYRRKGSSGR